MYQAIFILAQAPSATTEQVNNTLWGAVGILAIVSVILVGAAALKTLLQRKPDSEQFVTKQELYKLETSIGNCALKSDVKEVSESIKECASKDEVSKLADYTRQSFHDLRNAIQPLVSGMASVTTMQQVQKDQISDMASKSGDNHEILLEIRAAIVPNRLGSNNDQKKAV